MRERGESKCSTVRGAVLRGHDEEEKLLAGRCSRVCVGSSDPDQLSLMERGDQLRV